MGEVSGDEYPRRRGRERGGVDAGPARTELLEILSATFEEGEVRHLAGGDEHGVAGEAAAVGVVVDGGEAALFVVDTKAAPHVEGCDSALLVPPHLDGPEATVSYDPFLVSFGDLDGVGGHLLQSLEGDQAHSA